MTRIHELSRPACALVLAVACGACSKGPTPPPAARPAALPGIEQVELERHLLATPARIASTKPRGALIYPAAMLVPGGNSDPIVAAVAFRPIGRLGEKSLVCASLSGDSFEVAQDLEGKRWLASAAIGRARHEHGAEARVISVLFRDKFDSNSLYYMLAPWPMTEGITLQSRLLTPSAPVEHSREIKAAYTGEYGVITVGDCNLDGEDDFVVIEKAKAECLLISGSNLDTLATITAPGNFGEATCNLPDLDGDGIEEIFAVWNDGRTIARAPGDPQAPQGSGSAQPWEYGVLSPGKGTFVRSGKVLVSDGPSNAAWGATSAGVSADGRAQVALVRSNGARVQWIDVVDVNSGEALAPILVCGASAQPVRKISAGRIEGARRWLAWSTGDTSVSQRLFVAEIGVPSSTLEVAFPVDGREYTDSSCAVPRSAAESDVLAITVAVRARDQAPPAFDPVLFLDVARCFEKH